MSEPFDLSSLRDGILWTIILTVLFLCLCVLGVALLAVSLHVSNGRVSSRRERWEAAWQRRLTEVLVTGAPSTRLWATVRPRDRLYFVDFLLKHACRLSGDERQLLARLARPFLPQVAARAEARDPAMRGRAVYTLGLLDPATWAERVVRALDDPAPFVALAAARALAGGDRPEHARAVLARLERFPREGVNHLASLLSRIGPSAAPVLRKALEDRGNPPRTRLVAARALLYLRDPAAGTLLPRLLPFEKDRDLLTALLDLAQAEGGGEILPTVRRMLSSSDPLSRIHAVSALGKIGGKPDVERLMAALDDPSAWVALKAARGLRARGETDSLRALARSGAPRASLARQMLLEEVA